MPQVPTRHQGTPPPGVPWWLVGPTGTPSLIPSAHSFSYLQKPTTIVSFPVFLFPNLRFLISLLGAPFPKLFWGITNWYVTPPLVQLVFALVDYILHN